MESGDMERQNERRQFLLRRIKEEFPDAVIHEQPGGGLEDWCVLVHSRAPQGADLIVVFKPDISFMTDAGDEFERIVDDGIRKAREIFSDPPLEEGLQGYVRLTNRGIYFVQYEEPQVE